MAAVIPSKVLKFSKELVPQGDFSDKIDGPWGITFDSKGVMYVANFRRDSEDASPLSNDMKGPFGVTIITDLDPATSISKFIDLPTGGNPVMLANGFPLYGSSGKISYEPLMRLTGTGIDGAGNLWALNNWKPSLINNLTKNPGGDGAVVFIGVASI